MCLMKYFTCSQAQARSPSSVIHLTDKSLSFQDSSIILKEREKKPSLSGYNNNPSTEGKAQDIPMLCNLSIYSYPCVETLLSPGPCDPKDSPGGQPL